MAGRVIRSSGPLRYAIVDGMNVRDSRVHNYPPRLNPLISTPARLSGRSERLSAHAQCRLDRDRPHRDLRVVGSVRAEDRTRALAGSRFTNNFGLTIIGRQMVCPRLAGPY